MFACGTIPHGECYYEGGKGIMTVKSPSSRSRWLRIVGAGVAVIALSLVIVTFVVGVYAFVLAIQARGAPDQSAISRFAATVSPALMPWLEMLLTLLAAFWVATRTVGAGAQDGLCVGILAGLLNLAVILAFGGQVTLHGLVSFLVFAGLGWLGGFVGQLRTGRE
jgi:hypothetical protein